LINEKKKVKKVVQLLSVMRRDPVVQRKVLGIDPGLHKTGFSVATKQQRKITIVECGQITFCHDDSISKKIAFFYDQLTQKIEAHGINEIALETPFYHKNSMTFLKLGYLRSMVYLLKEQHVLILHEFAPRSIKQAITGFGGAEKEQVQKTLLHLFPVLRSISIKSYDITDAIAVSVCALWKEDY
jgi:crossover junction endodeoxyribonuclease RuvC